MEIDYWQRFLKSGSVQDFLMYKNSIIAEKLEKGNGKSENKNNRTGDKRAQDRRE